VRCTDRVIARASAAHDFYGDSFRFDLPLGLDQPLHRLRNRLVFLRARRHRLQVPFIPHDSAKTQTLRDHQFGKLDACFSRGHSTSLKAEIDIHDNIYFCATVTSKAPQFLNDGGIVYSNHDRGFP
jgi:hypothetical protein